ncbi:MAG TPA: lysophospholipid acyltransferase family protein [Kofleriaceae bacterium]|nr:lysophospholipid acyltransferase family protein [Kofleriaceae bacterium]
MELTTDRTSSPVFKTGLAALRRLGDYHQYRAYGLEKLLSTEGGLLVACNHSFATYDAVLLALAGYDISGRWFHAMADRLFFRIPVVSSFFTTMGFVEGTRATATELLMRGEVLGVLPGGMREALRPTDQRYTIDWRKRHGFVWLSMTTGTPIALAACPRADDIFSLLPNPVTPFVYDRFRLPLAVFRGRGPTPLPRPIPLHHLVSEPIHPPVAPDQVTERDVLAHHAHLTDRMNALMRAALELGASS